MSVQRPVKAAALVTLCVLAAGCGARVDDQVRQQVAAAALGQGGGGTGPVVNNDGTVTQPGQTPVTGPTSSGGVPVPGATSSGGVPVPGATGGTATQAPSGPVDNGGATDVGVSPTAITIGNVSDLSGPVPGLFQAAPYGVRAYVNYINSIGGVNGRQLKLVTADGQTDCTANKNAHTNLKNKVFAFVGSFSLYDNCGNDVLEADKNLPDISYPLALGKKNSKASTFSPAPTPPGYPNGMFQYYAQKFPNEVKKVGVIFPDVPAAAYNSRSIENAAKSAGWVYISRNSHAATASTFNDQVAAMKAAGVQLVHIPAENSANSAEIVREANAIDFHPKFVLPLAYASDFLERLGDNKLAEGIMGSNLYAMYFTKSDHDVIPEAKLFSEWYAKTAPGSAMEVYALYGWTATKLFVEALKKAGPQAKRSTLISALRGINSYSADGLLATGDPGRGIPSTCFILWTIQNGQYVRQDVAPGKYRCEGRYVTYSGN